MIGFSRLSNLQVFHYLSAQVFRGQPCEHRPKRLPVLACDQKTEIPSDCSNLRSPGYHWLVFDELVAR